MSKRLVDVLDEKGSDFKHREFWSDIFGKMGILLDLMMKCKGNYDIDDPEIRWVSDRIEYWENQERLLSKDEMLMANVYWAKYHK
jgi:hypothetical protein